MKLNILISTINEGILNIDKILLPMNDKISYVISHQITNNKDYKIYVNKFLKRKDIIYSILHGPGLSKNRNNCLRYSDGDILYICDDDVVISYENIFKIIKKFEINTELVVARCQIKTFNGSKYKKYKAVEYRIQSLRDLTDISSIEMIVRSSFLKEQNIIFDEKFGIGAEYAIGEDFIFITDIFKKAGCIVHYPIDLVKHEALGTGSKLSDKIIYARGAVFARVFGLKSVLINILFSIKKYKKYKHRYAFLQYVNLMLQGSFDFISRKYKRNR